MNYGELLKQDLGLEKLPFVWVQRILRTPQDMWVISYDSRYPGRYLSSAAVRKLEFADINRLSKTTQHYTVQDAKLTPPILIEDLKTKFNTGSLIFTRDLAGHYFRNDSLIKESTEYTIIPIEEKFKTAGKIRPLYGGEAYLEIFINPNAKELAQCGEDSKGIIDTKGNLYIGCSDSDDVLHVDIINFMLKKKLVPGKPFNDIKFLDEMVYNFLGVLQSGNSKDFFLSSSYRGDFPFEYEDEISEYLELAQSKNPSINFIF